MEGLRLLNRADPLAEVTVQETGEHVLGAAGVYVITAEFGVVIGEAICNPKAFYREQSFSGRDGHGY
jgi:hypothetical protein